MKKTRLWIMTLLVLVIAAASYVLLTGQTPRQASAAPGLDVTPPTPKQPVATPHVGGRTFRVLHIMSYDSSWEEWTLGQFNAFKEQLAGLPIEYKVFEMDVRRNTSPEWKQKVTAEAKLLIDTWKPDLVYTTDDFVQSAVVKDYLNTDLPFVFSGVNADPAVYGFVGSRNVTGVLEREHIVQTINLLKTIVPNVQRIAVISHPGETWPPLIKRIQQCESELPATIVTIDWVETFAEYQAKLRSYPGRVDAIITLGVVSLKDENGKVVPVNQVMRWTYEEIPLPNVSFWTNRVPQGLLCAVAISSYAQGSRAGEIARQILENGKKPSEIEIQPTLRGQPIVNLAAARKLGLKVPSTVLLTAKVVTKNEWE